MAAKSRHVTGEQSAEAKIFDIRNAVRKDDKRVVSVIKGHEEEEGSFIDAMGRVLRESGATAEQIEIYTKIEAARFTGEKYLRRGNYLTACTSFEEAHRMETDEKLRKKWMKKVIGTHQEAIEFYAKQGDVRKAAVFARRLADFLGDVERETNGFSPRLVRN